MKTKKLEMTALLASQMLGQNPAMDALIRSNFTESELSLKITDRINSYEDACTELKITPLKAADFPHQFRKSPDQAFAEHQLETIIGALNEGWTPNWDNSSEYKYYNYFDMRKGFSFYGYRCNFSLSCVSSRLCFKNSELALYVAKNFLHLYKAYYTL